ncbi:MAG: hypothetical protein AB1634_04525 [Thermodesulfobacteriota bacterium]
MTNGKNPLILGCAAFGLDDMSVVCAGPIAKSADFLPACVVLPGHPNGPILTGLEARKARVHAGLPWPPEASVKAGEHLRRAPVCCVWRALTEARDSQARWEVGGGVSFPLARILAAHIADLLVLEEGNPVDVKVAVAIPDDLDEYGQKNLLDELRREFERRDRTEVRLLWRPVAAALAWLEEAGGDMKVRTVEGRRTMTGRPDDFLLVLYLGPDAIECVPFKLRVCQNQQGVDFIVPRRERPREISSLAGYDWVGRALAGLPELQGGAGDAFWRAFSFFPEAWQVLAGRHWSQPDLPQTWGFDHGYAFWNPAREDLAARFDRAVCGPSRQVQETLKASCSLRGSVPSPAAWTDRLANLVRETIKSQKGGQLVGMAVCGPFAPAEPPVWLRNCFAELEARGLDTRGPWDNREANRLWMNPGSEAIAQGAALFLYRLQQGEPTYLDTLPQYFLLAKKDGRYTTSPLVDAQDTDGGQEYKNDICRRFEIEQHSHELDIVISRGGGHDELLKPSGGLDRLDREVGSSADGLSIAKASLVRHLVRTAANREEALQKIQTNLRNIENSTAALRYADIYAELWHAKADGPEEKQRALGPETVNKREAEKQADTPFRRLTFPFPLPPPERMPVDLHVRIRPASGMAQMEVTPQDPSFLYGRRVYVDYRTMRPCPTEELVSDARGWPPLEELTPHPDPAPWRKARIPDLVNVFEGTTPRSSDFDTRLDEMYRFIKTRKSWKRILLPVLSQDGLAGFQEGERLVARFIEALQRHTTKLDGWDDEQVRSLLTRATWFYGATPQHVTKRIRQDLCIPGCGARTIEAGSRSLAETKDLGRILQCITKKIHDDNKFSYPSVRACNNIMSLRRNGHDALNEKTINILLGAVLMVIDGYAAEGQFKNKFFSGIKLMLYLLRYRKCDGNFLPASSEETSEIRDKLKGYLKKMEKAMPQNRYIKAKEIITGTIGYLDYAGKTDFLNILTEYSIGTDDEDAD